MNRFQHKHVMVCIHMKVRPFIYIFLNSTIHQLPLLSNKTQHFIHLSGFYFVFLSFDFCRFCVVIRFFIPVTTANDFYTRSYPLHYFLILILEKEPVFPFSMLSAKQAHYWYHFYNVFGMTRSLTEDWAGTSRTRHQHSTTRLSRRRLSM